MVKLEHILCSMNDRCKGEGLNRCPCCSWPPQSVDRLRHTMIVTFPLFLIHLAILVPSEVRSENDDCQANDVEWNDKDLNRRLKLWASTLGKNVSEWLAKGQMENSNLHLWKGFNLGGKRGWKHCLETKFAQFWLLLWKRR